MEAGRVLNIKASSTGDDVELVVGVVGCEYSFGGKSGDAVEDCVNMGLREGLEIVLTWCQAPAAGREIRDDLGNKLLIVT